jgi:hypothetical protein
MIGSRLGRGGWGLSTIEYEDPCVQDGTLMKRCPHGPVQAVFEVHRSVPLDDVREQVAEKRGILSQQCLKVECGLSGDEFVQAHLAGRHRSPILRSQVPVVRIRSSVANCFEDHWSSLKTKHPAWELGHTVSARSGAQYDGPGWPHFQGACKDGSMTVQTPALALLLDVDGPIASPVSRTVRPRIIKDLVALAAEGIPIIFNTGRSDAFIRDQVMLPMLELGIPANTVVHAICEKGAVWFSFSADGQGPIHVDESLAVPTTFGDDIRRLVAEDYAAHMFFDETKRAMVSVEQQVSVSNQDYQAEQKLFDAEALELMGKHGLGVVMLDHAVADGSGSSSTAGGLPIEFRVDPTIISTDIESVRLGKDLGASRAVELLAAEGIQPQAWRTVGDSRTDYAMADWLHHNDHAVKHVDVRPADGVPAKPYPILTAADLGLGADVIHDDAGAAFLAKWLEMVLTEED